MTDNLKYVRKLLKDAAREGYTFKCTYYDSVDYVGDSTRKALESLVACDEMMLRIYNNQGRQIACALVINGWDLDADEVIADYGGDWMDDWWNANIGNAASEQLH